MNRTQDPCKTGESYSRSTTSLCESRSLNDATNPMTNHTIHTDDVKTLDETMRTLVDVNRGRIESITLWYENADTGRVTEWSPSHGPHEAKGFINSMADRPSKYTDMVLKVEVSEVEE